MNKLGAALLVSVLMPASAYAQDAPVAQPAVIQQAAPEIAAAVVTSTLTEAQLSAKSEVILSINEEINSKSHRLGDQFNLTVAQDVRSGGYVVIPRGTRAVGQVVSRTGNGSFGKAGKMDVAFRYIDWAGQRIPLEGTHHQEGDSATAATVGAILGAGVIGGMFVKGKNARIQDGREFTARLLDVIPLILPASASEAASIAPIYTPTPVAMEVQSKKDKKKKAQANRRT